ncbi:MAG: hypothetical protein A3I89_02550 [Candidatus Harrisonbacteria bacterium RIFCSPLOWO2_02_FULL_41_11]|uniref:Uncharacterized protein n=1 Tax=Candidatus Harrisonbacteria bacterium RIFCSPHIGHO2_02_FULL_42_16 TaxID=1798404 RepID=A0A1G1ZKA3_9BACT|nr:MAG: hypothetical protein A3B92_00265 [Candidatus Harrisonbacteria bacterium RIFCSPHIGHO2_02_FULL_42_16]OGY66543.1 MAG: hypothetical protein A3I89_02550 [Candidatus Harrisonbacteria bacterium RIFCSPLOWO2_02_FULL_41_11]
MTEKIPSKNKEMSGGEESHEQLVHKVRERFIYQLRQAMEAYGPKWVNKEICADLIDDLSNKRPTKIGGVFWADILDGVLDYFDIKHHTDGRYEVIWEELERGSEDKMK